MTPEQKLIIAAHRLAGYASSAPEKFFEYAAYIRWKAGLSEAVEKFDTLSYEVEETK